MILNKNYILFKKIRWIPDDLKLELDNFKICNRSSYLKGFCLWNFIKLIEKIWIQFDIFIKKQVFGFVRAEWAMPEASKSKKTLTSTKNEM